MNLDRRQFLTQVTGSTSAALLLQARMFATETPPGDPRLGARPGTPTEAPLSGRNVVSAHRSTAMIYAPAQLPASPGVIVFLHGALRTVEVFVDGHVEAADKHGVIIVAPFAAGGGTWDAIRRGFSEDPLVIDAALRWVFDRWKVDPARVAMSGFSDGGTYALAMGRANGDLFSRIAAYSPGFLIDVAAVGMPKVLITHGTNDRVLPIDATSRQIVPALRRAGYTVDYREFAGPHAVLGPALADFIAAT